MILACLLGVVVAETLLVRALTRWYPCSIRDELTQAIVRPRRGWLAEWPVGWARDRRLILTHWLRRMGSVSIDSRPAYRRRLLQGRH